MDAPGLGAEGDSQQDKDAMHVCALHCYDGRGAGNVEDFQLFAFSFRPDGLSCAAHCDAHFPGQLTNSSIAELTKTALWFDQTLFANHSDVFGTRRRIRLKACLPSS
jgi:hypothetical protein